MRIGIIQMYANIRMYLPYSFGLISMSKFVNKKHNEEIVRIYENNEDLQFNKVGAISRFVIRHVLQIALSG